MRFFACGTRDFGSNGTENRDKTGDGGFGSRFSLTDEGQATSQGRGIFACAKTGYVVLRIEPGSQGRPSRPYRASSAISDALRGLAPCRWATSHASRPEGGRSTERIVHVDNSGMECRWLILEGRWLTHEGP
ncbi:MAG TPA: hypothetical protein VGU23_01625, partial [Acidobacteriaceae bacterium]|nr:hypothetical protein [Acidobacteriaceae bacterium]